MQLIDIHIIAEASTRNTHSVYSPAGLASSAYNQPEVDRIYCNLFRNSFLFLLLVILQLGFVDNNPFIGRLRGLQL